MTECSLDVRPVPSSSFGEASWSLAIVLAFVSGFSVNTYFVVEETKAHRVCCTP